MVTTIEEVRIAAAYVHGTGNHYLTQIDPKNKTGYSNWQNAIIVRDSNHNIVTPQPTITNQQFIDWENSLIAQETLQQSNQAMLISLANTAAQYRDELMAIYGAIKQAQINGSNRDDTFEAITDALTAPGITTGFRNVVIDAYTSQGITLNLGNLPLTLDPMKEQFNAFADRFFTGWIFMSYLGIFVV